MGTGDYPPLSADCPRWLTSVGLDQTTGVTLLVFTVGLGKAEGAGLRSLGLPEVSEQSWGVKVERK